MSVARCLEINARLRAAGITVREAAGWQSRGNGQTSAYEGGLVHHTATGYGVALPGTGVGNLLINGRPDLRGPLCNYAGNDDGSITVIAAHPANHAGASGGAAMGPLPVTTLFNKHVLGLEIVYPGTSAMRAVQWESAVVWGRAVADVVGYGNPERVRAHAETSITGKWDPGFAPSRTIDMRAYRYAVANHLRKEDDMFEQADRNDVQFAAWRVYALANALTNVPNHNGVPEKLRGEPVPLVIAFKRLEASNAQLAAAVAEGDLDPERLTARLEAVTRDQVAKSTTAAITGQVLPQLQAVLTEALGADNAAQTEQILDRVAAALQARPRSEEMQS